MPCLMANPAVKQRRILVQKKYIFFVPCIKKPKLLRYPVGKPHHAYVNVHKKNQRHDAIRTDQRSWSYQSLMQNARANASLNFLQATTQAHRHAQQDEFFLISQKGAHILAKDNQMIFVEHENFVIFLQPVYENSDIDFLA